MHESKTNGSRNDIFPEGYSIASRHIKDRAGKDEADKKHSA